MAGMLFSHLHAPSLAPLSPSSPFPTRHNLLSLLSSRHLLSSHSSCKVNPYITRRQLAQPRHHLRQHAALGEGEGRETDKNDEFKEIADFRKMGNWENKVFKIITRVLILCSVLMLFDSLLVSLLYFFEVPLLKLLTLVFTKLPRYLFVRVQTAITFIVIISPLLFTISTPFIFTGSILAMMEKRRKKMREGEDMEAKNSMILNKNKKLMLHIGRKIHLLLYCSLFIGVTITVYLAPFQFSNFKSLSHWYKEVALFIIPKVFMDLRSISEVFIFLWGYVVLASLPFLIYIKVVVELLFSFCKSKMDDFQKKKL